MKRVIIESPYSGDIEKNIKYARMCIKDSLSRNEAPIASHLLYTQEGILDDNIVNERVHGIQAGLEWQRVAELVAVYTDYGISEGMKHGIYYAEKNNKEIEYRQILNTEL